MSTNKTEIIFRYIVRFKKQSGGASPTLRQIMRGVGMSSGGVNHHLQKLIAEKRIIRDGYHISIPGEVWYLPAVTPDGVPVV